MIITFTFQDKAGNKFTRPMAFSPAFEAFNTLGWVTEHFATAIEDTDVNAALNTFLRTLATKMEAGK